MRLRSSFECKNKRFGRITHHYCKREEKTVTLAETFCTFYDDYEITKRKNSEETDICKRKNCTVAISTQDIEMHLKKMDIFFEIVKKIAILISNDVGINK